MTKKVTIALSIFSVFLCTRLSAQNVYFTGVGRALVTNDNLSDETNTVSKQKASGGYTLFDLGVYAKPNEVLRGGVILRARNEFGGFFGDGANLEFRQLQMEGLIAKKVKYDIGDIYLSHTQYTLWNNENIFGYNKYEANVFALRRDIMNYENFYVGNAWRMQGFNASSKITFKKGIESIGIRGYCGRTMPGNLLTIPDRYFYGGKLDLTQSKYIRIAGNVAGISDIAGTVTASEVKYNNLVATTDFTFTFLDNEKIKLLIGGEAGISNFKLSRTIDSSNNQLNDYFYDAGAKATYKPWNITVGASYRDVGYNFNSPMAQTRRLNLQNEFTGTTVFPYMNDGTTLRSPSLFDPYSQDTKASKLYNQSISTTLMGYNMLFDLVEPFGKATPNRRGFTFNIDVQPASEILKAGLEVNLLSEGVSQGDSVTFEKRKFTKIQGGLVFNINKLISFEKLIAINAGIRTEGSKRVGTNPLNLSSALLDLGLDIEVLKDLHLLGGTKFFTVKGTEYSYTWNEMNQIVFYGTGFTANQTQNILCGGLRYDYDKSGYFSVQYHTTDFSDAQVATNKYKLNQLFFVFGLKF